MTLWFWRFSMTAWIGLSVAAALPSAGAERMRVVLAAGALVAVALSVISGMLYKIVPFLTWLHLTNRLYRDAGLRRTVPNVHQILPRRGAAAQFVAHAGAALLVLVAAAYPIDVLVRAAGGLLAGSCVMLGANLLYMACTYRRYMTMV